MTIFATCGVTTAFGRAVLYDLDHPLGMHAHSSLHVLMHVGHAPATYTFGDGERHVSQDREATFVNPWMPHADFREGGARSEVLAFYIEPGMVRRPNGHVASLAFERRGDAVTRTNLDRAHRLADLLRQGPDREDSGEGAFDELMSSLLHMHTMNGGAARFPTNAVLDRHVRAALRWLIESKGRPFDGEGLVRASGMARSSLFERFRYATGMTPKAYADTLRVEEAIRLLATTEEEVAAIGRRLGFEAPGNFSRFVRALTGLTPSQHRHSARARGDAPLRMGETDEDDEA